MLMPYFNRIITICFLCAAVSLIADLTADRFLQDSFDPQQVRYKKFREELALYFKDREPLEPSIPEEASTDEKDLSIYFYQKHVKQHENLLKAMADLDKQYEEFSEGFATLISSRTEGSYSTYLYYQAHVDLLNWYIGYLEKHFLNKIKEDSAESKKQ